MSNIEETIVLLEKNQVIINSTKYFDKIIYINKN